jgi:hypothetical protein
MYHGYTRVANMEGGVVKWAAKGFPVKGARVAVPVAAAPVGRCCSPTAHGIEVLLRRVLQGAGIVG